MTTDQKEFIECKLPNQCPITFGKRSAKKFKIRESALGTSDMKSFGSDIGYITNCSTALYAMLQEFEKDSEEYKEIQKRLLICRKLQGEAIDHAKGIQTDPFPRYWVDDKKCRNELDKKLLIKRKPYFQRYVYSSLNRRYMKYEKDLNDYSYSVYGVDTEDNDSSEFLELKENINPVLDNDSVMNKICHYLEQQVVEIKRDFKEYNQFLLDAILIDTEYDLLLEHQSFVEEVLKEYKQARENQRESENDKASNNFNYNFSYYCRMLREKLLQVFPDNHTMANMVVYVGYSTNVQENKDFVWNVCGDDVLENVYANRQKIIYLPSESELGDIKYLGKRYIRKQVHCDGYF